MYFKKCYKCETRYPGCHGSCNHYENACKKNNEEKKLQHKESLATYVAYKSWGYTRGGNKK